jgi:tripartite-type tricarboxylate transporter receptor subunit TctC
MLKCLRDLAFVCISSWLLLTGPQASAQTYPDKPITLVLPFGAGSSSDTLGRIIAEHVGREIGQRIIVENRPGAGGNTGTGQAAQAKPDGYTLVLAAPGPFVINKTLMQLTYDPETDFEMISPAATMVNFLVINPQKIPAKTVQEFIAYAKKNPGLLSYGSMGPGTTQHIAGAHFDLVVGTRMVHVPYNAGGPLALDLARGDVPVAFQNYANVAGSIAKGELLALAVAAKTRSAFAKDIPTMPEQGVNNFESYVWFGIAAPKGTPAPIVKRLNEAMKAALNKADVKALLLQIGVEPWTTSPEEFTAFIREENKKWPPILREIMAKK